MPDWRRSLLVAGLLLGAAASTWLLWFQAPPPSEPSALPPRSDYVLQDFTLRSFDADGRPEYQINAPYLEREPGLESVLVQTPLMWLFDAAGLIWELRSDTAWVSDDNEQIELRGPVLVDGPVSDEGGAVAMRSSDLLVWPRRDLIEGSSPVLLTQPGSRLSGVGMRAHLEQRRFEILNQAKARYDAHVP